MAAHEKNLHQGRKLRVQVYNDRMAHQCEHCEYTSKEKRRLDDHVRWGILLYYLYNEELKIERNMAGDMLLPR